MPQLGGGPRGSPDFRRVLGSRFRRQLIVVDVNAGQQHRLAVWDASDRPPLHAVLDELGKMPTRSLIYRQASPGGADGSRRRLCVISSAGVDSAPAALSCPVGRSSVCNPTDTGTSRAGLRHHDRIEERRRLSHPRRPVFLALLTPRNVDRPARRATGPATPRLDGWRGH
jgi:hypothetical protein